MDGYWKATNNMRWLINTTDIMKDYGDGCSGCVGQKEEKVLQQMWQCSDGKQEWKDLDVVYDYELEQ